MARIEVVCANEDREQAEALAAFLRTRAHHVWGEVGKPGIVPISADLVVVVLWSQHTMFSMQRMQIERRALDAWTEGRLVLVRMDPHGAPVGLRDLPSVEMWKTVPAMGFQQVDASIRAATSPPPATGSAGGGGEPPEQDERDVLVDDEEPTGAPFEPAPQAKPAPVDLPYAAPPERAKSSGSGVLLAALVVGAIAASALVGAQLPWPWSAALPGAVLVLGVLVGVASFAGGTREEPALGQRLPQLEEIATRAPAPAKKKEAKADAPPPAPPMSAPAPAFDLDLPASFLFVSYAHADRPRVDEVIDATRSVGKEVWTDAKLPAGPGWAGEIVKALKASDGIIVCCSTDAFESDHVKREVYLADRFKKRMLPVFLDNIEPPDDFLYFFADRQWLFAHQANAEELKTRIAAALS